MSAEIYKREKNLDTTLTLEGKAADAKAVGDALSDKVDKVEGKGLSTNDYTDEDKSKLDSLTGDANAYTLPIGGTELGGVKNGGDIEIDSEGKMNIPDSCINTQKIADKSVTNAKLADSSVNAAKISSGAVTREKLAQDALFSPVLAIETDTLIGAEHCGMTLLAGTGTTLSLAYDETIPVGMEFAVLNTGEAAVTISAGVNAALLLCDGSTPETVTVTPFGMAAAKLISRDTVERLDRWYISGNAEVVG